MSPDEPVTRRFFIAFSVGPLLQMFARHYICTVLIYARSGFDIYARPGLRHAATNQHRLRYLCRDKEAARRCSIGKFKTEDHAPSTRRASQLYASRSPPAIKHTLIVAVAAGSGYNLQLANKGWCFHPVVNE